MQLHLRLDPALQPHFVSVVQLGRALASEAEGCWFDSSRGHLLTSTRKQMARFDGTLKTPPSVN